MCAICEYVCDFYRFQILLFSGLLSTYSMRICVRACVWLHVCVVACSNCGAFRSDVTLQTCECLYGYGAWQLCKTSSLRAEVAHAVSQPGFATLRAKMSPMQLPWTATTNGDEKMATTVACMLDTGGNCPLAHSGMAQFVSVPRAE